MLRQSGKTTTLFICILGLCLFSLPVAERTASAEIKIGVIAPLSGALADYGLALQRGMEIALQQAEIRNVRIIFEDTPYDAKASVTAFHKLRETDRVDIIYVWGVIFCKAVAPLADIFRMPTVGQCIDPFSGQGSQYFIRFQSSSIDYMKLQVKRLRERGIRSLALIVSDNGYTIELQRALSENLEDLQLQEVQLVGLMESDYRSLIARLKKSGIESVGVFLMPGQLSTFFRQARQQNFRPLFFGTNIFESEHEVRQARGAMQNSVYVVEKVAPWFRVSLQQKYGSASQLSFSALAHDFTELINKLSTDRNNNGAAILQQLSNLKSGQGKAAGKFEVRNTEDQGVFFDFELEEKTIFD